MLILGISAFYHDSAACLVCDGKIIAAAQQERFSRIKHDASFPTQAIDYCLSVAGAGRLDLDYVAFYDKPHLKFERILKTYLDYAPYGYQTFKDAMLIWRESKFLIKRKLQEEFRGKTKFLFPEHHESHAMSAFYPSPFSSAAILTIDGVGEYATTTLSQGKGDRIEILSQINFPHSLGLLYSTFTSYIGFKVNSGEYKVMGLAPYGVPKYKQLIYDHLIDVKPDGSFHLNMEHFDFPVQSTMINDSFYKIFGGKPRQAESELTQREMDLARSIQDVTEEVVVKMATHAKRVTGSKNLCLAGGVALNCVANSKISSEKIFDNIWIQPAAGDAGGALGAAIGVWYQYLGNERKADNINDQMNGTYLGPQYSDQEVIKFLEAKQIPYQLLDENILYKKVASLIANGSIIGWFQGRMEFGPRSLGNRSIIGDPQSPKMQERMNLKIKFRESFRPFAPSVLMEKCSQWFELNSPSPYMLLVASISKSKIKEMSEQESKLFGIKKLNIVRSNIPAVTHIDYSARVQTVEAKQNKRFHQLITEFDKQQGCPLIVNTSFNVRGEPPVSTPENAYRCFINTHMDYLVMGNVLIDKLHQPSSSDKIKEFELD
ncbi:MAG: carbamoyltransferase [Bdellovibrionales bacterium]|nr:carbamoyltransferase [Bdellovibrionales bacterium]MBT3525374.1 carbamoyltransferase [Bdellovibrionales bacterium]MBT7670461.1 carbamoyltransferase [Bdellovibrionales bacterium]